MPKAVRSADILPPPLSLPGASCSERQAPGPLTRFPLGLGEPGTHPWCGLLGAGGRGWSWMSRSGSPALTARASRPGQQRPPCGQGRLCVGILASVLGPQGLGQGKTLKDGAAPSHAEVGLPRRGLEAEAAGHTDHGQKLGWASPGLGSGRSPWTQACAAGPRRRPWLQ